MKWCVVCRYMGMVDHVTEVPDESLARKHGLAWIDKTDVEAPEELQADVCQVVEVRRGQKRMVEAVDGLLASGLGLNG